MFIIIVPYMWASMTFLPLLLPLILPIQSGFLLRFLLSSQEFIKMMSVCFYVLISFLPTVGKTEDKKDVEDNCCWECKFDSMNRNVNLSSELNWKIVLYKTGHMRAKFLVNKRVEQGCSSSKENTSEPIEVWIYMAQDQASSIYGSSSFGLLSFAIMSILVRWPISANTTNNS